MSLINMTTLCRQLNKSAPTIRNYVARGLPVVTEGNRSTGQEWVFDSDDCQEWFDDYQDKLLAAAEERHQDSNEDEEDDALKQAKLEKIRVETQRLEIRLAKEQGELVPIDSVGAIVERHYAAVRAQLIALPNKLAPLVAGMNDVQEIDALLKSYLFEALSELQVDEVITLKDEDDEEVEVKVDTTVADGSRPQQESND